MGGGQVCTGSQVAAVRLPVAGPAHRPVGTGFLPFPASRCRPAPPTSNPTAVLGGTIPLLRLSSCLSMMNPWFAKEVPQVLTTGQGDLPQGDGSMLLGALSPGGRSRGPVVPWLLPHRQIKLNKVTKVAKACRRTGVWERRGRQGGERPGEAKAWGPAPPRTNCPQPGHSGAPWERRKFPPPPPVGISESFIFLASLAKKQKGTIDSK